ncbi:MAG: hypothetical protein ACOYNY_35275 [Caldilineaceae bacterium]
MLQPSLPRWRQRFIVVLLLAFLTTAALTPTRPVHAQESPLPTPTSVQVPSPLPSPTAGDAGTAATTDAPSSLAGTALTSPGAIAVIVLAALVIIGGVVRYWQHSQS